MDSEHIIQSNNIPNKTDLRYQFSHEIKKTINNKQPYEKLHNNISIKKLNHIISKIQQNNLTVNNADKGNIITIENKHILKQKTNTFLDSPLYQKLKTDPTCKFQSEIKNNIKQSNLIINSNNNRYINSNPSAPKLRVTTKIHKENNPIRPIVNYKSAPAYNIKKQIVKILKEKLIINNNYNIYKFNSVNKRINKNSYM